MKIKARFTNEKLREVQLPTMDALSKINEASRLAEMNRLTKEVNKAINELEKLELEIHKSYGDVIRQHRVNLCAPQKATAPKKNPRQMKGLHKDGA